MFRNHRHLFWIVAGLLASSLSLGCGGEEDGGLPVDEVAEGWNAFVSGRYGEGIGSFQAAIGKAPGWGEPYSGRGWCYAAIDSLAAAEENFALAVARSSNLTDAWAGNAIVNLALQDYPEGRDGAFRALETGQDNYVFRYDSQVDARALRIVLAECAFNLGDYKTAEDQVELVDLQLMLDSNDPDYEKDLLEAIARLSRQ